jgi:hypothetical protein
MGSATQFSLHEGDESSRFRNSPIGIPSAGDDGSWKVRQPFSDLGRIGKSPTSKYAAHICASPSSLLTRTTQRSNGFEGATLLNCSIITGIDVRKVVAADLTKASSMFSGSPIFFLISWRLSQSCCRCRWASRNNFCHRFRGADAL